MAEFSACKVVASLPGTLAASTLYLVRVGTGFRPYVTNATGTIVAYALDPIAWSELAGIPANLTALASLTSAANKGIQFTGSGTAATFDLTAAGKALLDDSDAAAQRTTLGLGTAAVLAADTDGTFAADSDSRLPTQAATRDFVAYAVTPSLDRLDLQFWARGLALADLKTGVTDFFDAFGDSFLDATGVDGPNSASCSTADAGTVRPALGNSGYTSVGSITPATTTAFGGYTYRTIIAAAQLADLTANAVRVRIHCPASGSAMAINAAYIGVKSGSYAFVAPPTQLTFGGATNTNLPVGGGTVYSDPVFFAYTGTSDLVVSYDCPSGSGMYYNGTSTGWTSAWKSGSGDAVTQAATGYTQPALATYAVSAIEATTLSYGNLDLRSVSRAINDVPQSADVYALVEETDALTANTDLKLYASRDGNTGYVQGTAAKVGTLASGYTLWRAPQIDLTGQASAKNLRYRATSSNAKNFKIHAALVVGRTAPPSSSVLQVAQATTTTSGIVLLAQQSDLTAGSDAAKAIASDKLFAEEDRRLRIRYGASLASYSTDCFGEQGHDPTARGFSWYNQGSSTWDATVGRLTTPTTSGNVTRGLLHTLPSGNWFFALWCKCYSADRNVYGAQTGLSGKYNPYLGFLLSDGTKHVMLGLGTNSASNSSSPYLQPSIQRYSNATTFVSSVNSTDNANAYEAIGLRNNGGNLTLSARVGGVWMNSITSETLTTYLTPTLLGFGVNTFGSPGAGTVLELRAYRRLE